MKNFIELTKSDGSHYLINVNLIVGVTTDDGFTIIDTVAPGYGLMEGYSGTPLARYIVSEGYAVVKALIEEALR